MAYIPINLDLQDKIVKVIGGGKIAERRVNALINSEALIHVISPELTDKLKQYEIEGKLKWHKKDFEISDIEYVDFIINATNSPEITDVIKDNAPKHCLINMVGDAQDGNVIFPGTLNRGKLQISVTSNGASPKLVRNILKDLEQQYSVDYTEYVDFLYECRTIIKSLEIDQTEKNQLLENILSHQYFDTIEQNKFINWLKRQLK